MKDFKFLRENKPTSSPNFYEEMVAAIIVNQYRNGFEIIGAVHHFRDSEHNYFRLEIIEHIRAADMNFITYKVEKIRSNEDPIIYVFEMSDYLWNRIIEN